MRDDGQRIGWPRRTLLARMIELGPTGASSRGPPGPTPDPPHAIAIIDCAVSRLTLTERRCVSRHYNADGRGFRSPASNARLLDLSASQYRSHLSRAKRRIADHLRGAYDYAARHTAGTTA